ncbi:unnamed protein product [Didymodactylos carnosus]|uniref:Aminotransferase class I/classII large domain-containing protein n=1 Tax=Didymodactylos carnosus TaxID=1234261 RepID=A0A813TJP8_9BILA|nr:unnamed protein product [Didymodactylos carnosus]CAF0809170.1 unnamed protein product [Didymodactylos carnosus]CAF3535946.1 unnamed protein product [Didymodactylos carnosus]CAF3594728.1 unnamed protein product [Didymodactylos carnosus]
MVISNGATCVITLLSYVLADDGDVFLISSPFYTVLDHDVNVLTKNSLVRCPLLGQEKGEFSLHVDSYKHGYEKAQLDGLRVRGIIIVNPGNPVGDIYDERTLMPILEFAAEKQLHVIVDEIYALSTFTTLHEPFQSILSYKHLPDPKRTHFVWAFSKDFSMSGVRVGVLYSSIEVCMIASKVNFSFLPSGAVQGLMMSLLSDKEWTNRYVRTNKERLTEKFYSVKKQLELMSDGRIKVYEAQAGLFIWADFGLYLNEKSFDEELKLFNMIFDAGLYITCGKILGCNEPGWFRLIFSVKDSWIEEGLIRLKTALNKYEFNT